MTSVTLSSTTPSFVFCPPPPGKPDPSKSYDPSSRELRPRVPMPGQKGDTCIYYALQILRNDRRIGKHPLPGQEEARAFEVAASAHRKAITLAWEKKKLMNFFLSLVFKEYESCSEENVFQYLRKNIRFIKPEKYQSQIKDALAVFLRQNDYSDISTWIQETYHQEISDIRDDFLRQYSREYEAICRDMAAMLDLQRGEECVPFSSDMFSELDPYTRLSIKAMSINQLMMQKYGCKKSSWHPDDPLESLIHQIQVYGPHIVLGHIGRSYYKNAPYIMSESLEGRSIFAWKPNSERFDINTKHGVILVGGQVKGRQQLVYFIDPLDGSDPQDVSTQKIYAISYENLRSNISNFSKGQLVDSQGKNVCFPKQEGENDYAAYI